MIIEKYNSEYRYDLQWLVNHHLSAVMPGWSPVLFMAGGDIAPPIRAFLTLDELPKI